MAAEASKSGAAERRVQQLALIGMLVNLGLASLKMLAGILGHSYALIADAAESLADILGSVVILGGLHIASRPADQNHPYGHGKAESLAAFIVALMILGAGVGIAIKAVDQLISPHHAPAPWTLVVLVAVITVKLIMFRVVRRAGRQTGSGAATLDAWHHWADAFTSLAAFVGITVAWVGGPGYERADPIAALLASVVIIVNALLLSRSPIRALMDAEPSDIVGRAREVAAAVPGVIRVEKIGARTSGVRHFIDMHIWLEPSMSVFEAHELSHRVKDAVQVELPSVADVLVHVEPARHSR